MKYFVQSLQRLRPSLSWSVLPAIGLATVVMIACAMNTPIATAASKPAERIAAEINVRQVVRLPNSLLPMAQPKFDTGRVAPETKIQGVSLYFSRTDAQEAALKQLIAAQQNPSSPQYHHWLTPDQFATRFGMSDADIAKVQSWLEQQGFSVDSVGRSRNMIRFSGTVGQVESAFATEIHNYSVPIGGKIEKHFAPSTQLSVPASLAGVVQGIRNLDDFRPHAHVILSRNKPLHAKPNFTGYDGSLFFAPGDIVEEYDIQGAYNSLYNGSGQTIAVVGQSEIAVSDIEAFQAAAGLTKKDPTTILVPGTGSATFSSGDETESDLDLEWSGAIATGANIQFIYTGSNTNYGTFDSIQYAVDNKIGTIISNSYGSCEADLGGQTLESIFEQAVSQGQSITSAAGDDGSTDCFGDYTSGSPTTAEETLAVDYPASSPYVTGVGGTEISQANSEYETPDGTYWTSTGSSDIITSVKQYIPEQAWNEDASCLQSVNLGGSPICAGGGGASTLFAKPGWQTGVPGIPSDGHRDVPDVSLNSAINNPGYLLCTSDTAAWLSGQTGSCVSGDGFRDSGGNLTVAGGTSFASPIFAGMLAIINQQQGYTTGQGLANPTLYTLASDTTTYAAAFHDITAGNNDCDAGSSYCNGTIGFSAGTGYDQATGLGTIQLTALASAWKPATGTTLIATTTTVSASNTAPSVNTADTFTITVASDTGSTVPAGTVAITVDSLSPVTETLTSNGTYTYSTTFTTSGTHTVTAIYSGDTTHATSTGSAAVNVPVVSTGTGTFTLSATNVTVTQGNSGTSTITVTPAGGYTGSVQFTVTANSTVENDTCETSNNAIVNSSGGTGTVTINTNPTCGGGLHRPTGNGVKSQPGARGFTAISGLLPPGQSGPIGAVAILTGLLLAGLIGRSSRRLGVMAGVIVLGLVSLAFSGCSGGNSVGEVPTGTYKITVTGTDTASASIMSTTTFTLTVQ